MKLKNTIYVIGIMTIISSCGIPQDDYDKIIEENKDLKTNIEKITSELDECQNGAEKTVAKVLKAYSEKDYISAKENINRLSEKHPESPKNAEFKTLLETIKKEELALNIIKEAEEKERIRLANINNTGMWRVGYYVDEFGESTKEGYITNSSLIKGVFSNTATQDSRLNVKFLISGSLEISIQLYEYADNNPVKAYSTENYRVLVQDKNGERLKLRAQNYSDRLTLNNSNSRKLHKALLSGGSVKFKIYEIDTPTTEYEFTILNADWYDNATMKLAEK
jgi:cell division septum initiation protein DivIVA